MQLSRYGFERLLEVPKKHNGNTPIKAAPAPHEQSTTGMPHAAAHAVTEDVSAA
jgi:hypothetical protein